jgi:hypothetical protein
MLLGPLITALISALMPVAVEGAKQGINKLTGGPKATTIDEQIKLDQSEVARMEALAKLDNPYGTPSQWVVDLRASARYIAAWAVIIGGGAILFISGIDLTVKGLAVEAISVAFGFLFGTRITANMKK